VAIKYRHQTTGHKLFLKADIKTYENVAKITNLRTVETNQKRNQEEIKSRLHSVKFCCHRWQKYLSSHLLDKNMKFINIPCSFVCVWNLVAHLSDRTQTKGVREQDV
jgi:hypothetical protein